MDSQEENSLPPPYTQVSDPEAGSSDDETLHGSPRIFPVDSDDPSDDPTYEPSEESEVSSDESSDESSNQPKSGSTSGYRPSPLTNLAYLIPGGKEIPRPCSKYTEYVTLEPCLSSDSQKLFKLLRRQIWLPIRPRLDIQGWHTETVTITKKGRREDRTRWFRDFHFKLDLAETMLAGWEHTPHSNVWMRVKVAKNGDNKPAFRRSWRHAENGEVAGGASDWGMRDLPDMKDVLLWCQRYCNDPSPVKSFTFRRELRGFDYDAMSNALRTHIIEQGYPHKTYFSFINYDVSFTIYSPHWINRLRLNKAVWWICVIFGIWIVTWPVILLYEKRYQVVRVEWDASIDLGGGRHEDPVYAQDRDEAQLAGFWAPAVKQAVQARRQSGILTRSDAERAQGSS